MEFISNLLGAIVMIALMIGFFWGFFYLMARVSKYTGKTYVFKDGGRVTPQSYDMMSGQLNDKTKAIHKSVKSFTMAVNQQIKKGGISDSSSLIISKLASLEALAKLRQNGTITDDEFNAMKKDLLK